MGESRPGKNLRRIGGALLVLAVMIFLAGALGGDRPFGALGPTGVWLAFYVFWTAVVVGSLLMFVGWFRGRSGRPT